MVGNVDINLMKSKFSKNKACKNNILTNFKTKTKFVLRFFISIYQKCKYASSKYHFSGKSNQNRFVYTKI